MEQTGNLDTAAKIRLTVFSLVMLWGAALSVYFSRRIFDLRFGDHPLKILPSGISYIMVAVYAVIILILTMIPMYLFQMFALKRGVVTYPEEARYGKLIMIIAFLIVVFLSLIVTECTVYIPQLIFSLMWFASGQLCYIFQIKGEML